MSNGDSGSDQEQVGPEITVTDLGTNFNVDLREIKLTDEQRKAIPNAIINVILAGIARTDSANEYGCNYYTKFRNY